MEKTIDQELRSQIKKKEIIQTPIQSHITEKTIEERIISLEAKMFKLWELLTSDKNPKKEERLTDLGRKFKTRI